MTRYRKSWTQVLQEVREVTEVVEAVLVNRDYKYDSGKGEIHISKKNFKKVPKDYKNDTPGKETMITYDSKWGTVSVPVKFTEEVEATRMPMEAPFILDEKEDEDEGYGGTKKWKKGQQKLKKAGIVLHKKDRASGYVEGVTGPTRMDVQKHFDKEKGLLRVRINATEKALKISDMKVDAKGTVQSFKEEVELDEKWAVGGVYHQEYKNGDKTYFRADSVQKNKRWKGKSVDEIGGKQKKAKNNTADERVQGWETTPKNEIPKELKENIVLNEKEPAYPATIDTLRKIVKDKQNQVVMFKSGQARVDLFTASAMVQVYDALKKPDMKKHFEKMITDKAGFLKTQAFAMKMIG